MTKPCHEKFVLCTFDLLVSALRPSAFSKDKTVLKQKYSLQIIMIYMKTKNYYDCYENFAWLKNIFTVYVLNCKCLKKFNEKTKISKNLRNFEVKRKSKC